MGQKDVAQVHQGFAVQTNVVRQNGKRGALLTVLSQVPGQAQPSCTADGNGRFNPIYLNPALLYGVQLFSATGTLLQQTDPYVPKPLEINPVVKPANTSRTTNALLIDPDLQVAIPGPGTYIVEFLIEFDTNGVAGATPGAPAARSPRRENCVVRATGDHSSALETLIARSVSMNAQSL